MSAFRTAVAVEAQKAVASRVPWTVAILLAVGLAALAGGMLAGAASGDPQLVAKLGPVAAQGGWAALVGTATQILAAGGLLCDAILVSWLFGREFADGTVVGLFATAIPRATTALAKLAVYLAWAAVTAILTTGAVLAVGIAAGVAVDDPSGIGQVLRLPALVMLTAVLATPVAVAATAWRGLLPGIAVGIGILVVAQVCAVVGIGVWVPFVTPALWALDPATVPPAALALVATVPLAFGALTAWMWARLQLDR
ncbi:ABC transporter permease [Agromyces sp. MMS24-JH15]|uniref:ABC transporter permease n=1 Tax=Agromyces sp. MMS24-JH15 TaxID=3243765 RepID=UPI003748C3AB